MTKVRGYEDGGCVGGYITKYLSKVDRVTVGTDVLPTGRMWGYWNIKRETPKTFKIPPTRLQDALRAICNHVGVSEIPYRGFDPMNGAIFTGKMGESKTIPDCGFVLKSGSNLRPIFRRQNSERCRPKDFRFFAVVGGCVGGDGSTPDTTQGHERLVDLRSTTFVQGILT